MRRPITALCATIAAVALWTAPAQADPADFGLASVEASLSTNQAGAHPDIVTEFEVTTDPTSEANVFGLKRPYGVTRNVTVSLPPGLLANPNVVQQCTVAQLETWNLEEGEGGGCPNASQVGVVEFYAYLLTQPFTEPIYMMRPPGEDGVARLGFIGGAFPILIEANLRSDGDYGVDASVLGASGQQEVVKAKTTVWGVPAAKAHDQERCTPFAAFNGCTISAPKPPGGPLQALTANPTRCGASLQLKVAVDSYAGFSDEDSVPLGPIEGCDPLEFSPKLVLHPTSRAAAEPTGLDAELTMRQEGTELPPEGGGEASEEAEGLALSRLATSQMRYATVTLPEGMTIASGAGEGLQACSAEEVGLGTRDASHCPNAAKIASVQIASPALSAPVEGAVYQRTPVKGNLFGVWLVADELGIHLKLPGEVHADPVTGQLSTTFVGTEATEGLPQAPVSSFQLHFFGGPRAPLAAPRKCGTYYAEYEFVPWSGRPAAVGKAPMTFDEGCDTGGFDPKLSAGSANPLAGAFTEFLTTITLPSGNQNPKGLSVTLPPGALAKLAGVTLCEGAQAQSGDCPASARVGHGTVAAGPGPSPLWLPQPGRDPIDVYLSGPYNNAPYSLVVRAPAQAGPFDLGTVVTRAAINIDPETALATVSSDPLPQILEGVPIDYRTIHVAVDRPEFALNPTGCGQKETRATLTSAEGATANLTSPFRVGGCRGLEFAPQLSLRLKGATHRGAFPKLMSHLQMNGIGESGIASAQVVLPHSEFIEQGHFKTICTRVQFKEGAGNGTSCPAGSIYGRAKAVTPLLPEALEGPVLLRSNPARQLPDLVVVLRTGSGLAVTLVGNTDSVKGRLRSTFAATPDAPVSSVDLELEGGSKGLIVNSTELCLKKNRASVTFTGQNGKTYKATPVVGVRCKGKGRKPHHKRGGAR
jgi:hypothetical protein